MDWMGTEKPEGDLKIKLKTKWLMAMIKIGSLSVFKLRKN